jgi:ribosomal protein L30E
MTWAHSVFSPQWSRVGRKEFLESSGKRCSTIKPVETIMKTKTIYQVVVKDSRSKVADWTQEFEHRPTPGDRLRIPENVARNLEGYEPEATVSLVEMDLETGDFLIVADAACKLATNQRPVVTLNASLIPERIREEVEDHVRRRLDLPVLEWEDSSATAPIIRLHPFKSHPQTPLETLQNELRQILHKAVELAPC